MQNEDKEIAFLNFILQKEFIYAVLIVLALFLLYPVAQRTVERIRLFFVYNKMTKIANKQTEFFTTNGKFSNELYKLNTGYTDNNGNPFSGEKVATGNYSLRLGRKGVFATNNKAGYFVYYDYDLATLYCAPKSHHICKKIILMPKDFCLEENMIWSDRTNACYMNEKDLCLDLGMPWNDKINNGFCGYKDTNDMKIYQTGACLGTTPSGCQNSTVYENASCQGLAPFACIGSKLKGGDCIVRYDNACHSVQINNGSSCIAGKDFDGNLGCKNAIVNQGGTCVAAGNNLLGCHAAIVNQGGMCRGYAPQSCNNSVIFAGGVCEGNISTACQNVTVKNGGRCISNMPRTCSGTYEIGACCHGNFCPDNAPKCDCPDFATKC